MKPTPAQVKAEVWMAIIHGANGIIYFAHQFQPRFIEAGILADKPMAAAIQQINEEVQTVAPVLNSPAPDAQASVTIDHAEGGSVALMTRRSQASTYVFAVGMSDQKVTAHIHTTGVSGVATVQGEQRILPISGGSWVDAFNGYEVHIYVLHATPPKP